MKLIVSLGGSVMGSDPTPQRFWDLRTALETLRERGDEVHVVVGGGPLKEKFVQLSRACGLNDYVGDVLGIQLTRLYARLIASVLGDAACQDVPESVEEAVQARSTGKIVVMGGTEAGHSTTAVAALFAEAIGAELLLKLTDVDGIYSSNPKTHQGAVRFEELTYDEVTRILGTPEFAAGTYDVLDAVALGVLQRSSVDTVYFDGSSSLLNILKARSLEIGTYLTSRRKREKVGEGLAALLKPLGLALSTEKLAYPPSPSGSHLLFLGHGLRLSVSFRASHTAPPTFLDESAAFRTSASAELGVVLADVFSPAALSHAKKSGIRPFTFERLEGLVAKAHQRTSPIDAQSLRQLLGKSP